MPDSTAASIASSSFNSSPVIDDHKDGDVVDPDQTANYQALGQVGKSMSSDARNNTIAQYPGSTSAIDNNYKALFATGDVPRAQMPNVQIQPAQAQLDPPAAPMQHMQVQQPMAQPSMMPALPPPQMAPLPQQPPPQLAMSDRNVKKNIRPVRPDLDKFLKQVYTNVLNRKK